MKVCASHPSSGAAAAILALLLVSARAPGAAAPNHYGYPDEEGQRVHYDVARDEIAVRFARPLAAGSLAETVSRAVWADGICAARGSKPDLVYKGPVNATATDVARFAVAGCSATDRVLLARAIADNVADAEAAGLVITIHPSGRREVLTDHLVVELEVAASASESTFGQFHLSAPDPFSTEEAFFFRLYEPACVRDLTSTDCRDHGRCIRGGACVRKDLITQLQAASAGGTFRGQKVASVAAYLVPLSTSGAERRFDGWLEGEKSREENLTGTIGVSFTGNEAASESDFKLGTQIQLKRGTYPAQLRVDAGAQVQFKDNEVEEDVTKLRVNYDYYFERWLELYGFMERFTDNFLGIEQRYEAGFGVHFELDAKRRGRRPGGGERSEFCVGVPGAVHHHDRKGSGEEQPFEILVTRKTQEMLDVYRERIRREVLRTGAVSDATKKDYCDYKLGIQKRHARFQAGLALSVFGDFEQPDELTITATPSELQLPPDQGGPDPGTELEALEPAKVRPPSAHRFRLTVRPSLTFRPNDRTTLFGHYYFKPAYDEPQAAGDTEPAGELGRQEFAVGATIALTADDTGGQKVGLSVSAEQYHDRFPPRVTPAAALAAFGITDPTEEQLASLIFMRDGIAYEVAAGDLTARRTHTVYKFALTVSW